VEGLRERLERTRIRPLLWAAAGLGAVLVVIGLAVAPAVVLVVAAAILGLALFWKSSAKRSAGSGFVPTAVVWGGVVTLVLALGATSAQGVVGAWSSAVSALASSAHSTPGPGGTTAVPSPPPSSATAPASPGAPTSAGAAPGTAAGETAIASPATTGPSVAAAAPTAAPTSAPAPADGAVTPTFKNCGALRAAGIATLSIGEPGYSVQLDRDGDGIACN
jgi:hypothetical protein